MSFLMNTFERPLRAKIVMFEVINVAEKRVWFVLLDAAMCLIALIKWRLCSNGYFSDDLCAISEMFKQLNNVTRQCLDASLFYGERISRWRCFGNKGPQMTRLVTRTKESNICASILEILNHLFFNKMRNESDHVGRIRIVKKFKSSTTRRFRSQLIFLAKESLVKKLNESTSVRTRKMVNYACSGWSQRKLWWRSKIMITCKFLMRSGYRGERPIEPSSSWFLPKFPSG